MKVRSTASTIFILFLFGALSALAQSHPPKQQPSGPYTFEVNAEEVVLNCTVLDSKGRTYVDARNPSLGDRNRTRNYRDDLRQELTNSLGWLPGATVLVQVTPPTPVGPAAATIHKWRR